MRIRQAKNSDWALVENVVKMSFAGAKYADGNEAELVAMLRKSEAYIPELCLVAENGQTIIGFVMFTKAYVGKQRVLCLAPLCVLPAFQKNGVGTQLVQAGHFLAMQLDYSYSVVLGDPCYYTRLGYRYAKEHGIWAPNGIDENHLLAIQLDKNAASLSGKMMYAKEFNLD